MIITCLYLYSFITFLLQFIRNYNLIDIMKHNGHDIKRLANVLSYSNSTLSRRDKGHLILV